MAKHKIAIGRLCVSGSHRQEVANWLVEATISTMSDAEVQPYVEDLLHIPVAQVPTDVARNKLVQVAQKEGVDFLFQVDDDAAPPEGFFKAAFLFLKKQKQPSVIGCGYVCGGDQQQVQVFQWASPNNHAEKSFALMQIPREDAARRTGIEEVANIGTHCIAYDMEAFLKIKTPHYAYEYDEAHTKVLSTEEVYCHRNMWLNGVKLYCAWDFWAGHVKNQTWGKPYVLQKKDIDKTYLEQARGALKHDRQS